MIGKKESWILGFRVEIGSPSLLHSWSVERVYLVLLYICDLWLCYIDILNWDLGKKQGKVARTGRDVLKILFANLRKIHCIFMFGWVQEHPRSLFSILGKVSSCLTNFQLSSSLIEIYYPLIPTSTRIFSPLT